MQIAICAIVRNENLYIREWVEYHKKLGFDKIIIYDNNLNGGEYPQQVIGDYVTDGYVEVHNVRGYPFHSKMPNNQELGLQPLIYNKCRLENQHRFEWMAFIDVDEFITISENEPQNIHELFDKYGYDRNGFEQIVMCWQIMADDTIDYENKPVQERFTKTPESTEGRKRSMSDYWVKSMVRTNLPQEYQYTLGNEHALSNVYTCSEYGLALGPSSDGGYYMTPCIFHDILYVKHYYTKSFWEHITRRAMNNREITKNLADPNNAGKNFMRLEDYAVLNGWSDKHEKILRDFATYNDNLENIFLIQTSDKK